jgi:hypothetical protein
MKILISAFMLFAAVLPASAAQTACVYDSGGDAAVRKHGAADWVKAVKGLPLEEGDSLRTGDRAWCELLFKDGTFVKVDGNSETSVSTLKASAGERTFVFSFLKGKALWMAAKVKGAMTSKFEVRTPSAVCAVRGTDFVTAVSTSGATTLGLFDGNVSVSGGPEEKELLPGGEASVSGGAVAVQARLSRLMQAEQKRCDRLKARVEALRKRLAERDTFIDDYIGRQRKALADLESRRKEKLGKR